ncbi:MAG: hypothetical protein M3R00_03580 [Pseudomonadota bacterium]|nr:hypothetical protein [Pseudomonadota bacterium]
MEPVIKNPITVTVEAFQLPLALSSGSVAMVSYLAPTDAAGAGYDRLISALKTSELKEQKSFN